MLLSVEVDIVVLVVLIVFSCALLKLCAPLLLLLLAPVLTGPRRIHVAVRGRQGGVAALEMSMLPIEVHKVLSQVERAR